jgi:hypothetical protein
MGRCLSLGLRLPLDCFSSCEQSDGFGFAARGGVAVHLLNEKKDNEACNILLIHLIIFSSAP